MEEGTLITIIASGMAGLVGKIVFDWLKRPNQQVEKLSTSTSDWGTLTYLKSTYSTITDGINKIIHKVGKISDATEKIISDHSYVDEKTGRKLHLIPSSMVEDTKILRETSFESISILKKINENLKEYTIATNRLLSEINSKIQG